MADWDTYAAALRTLGGLTASEKRACDEVEERATAIVDEGGRDARASLAGYERLTSQIAGVQTQLASLLAQLNGSPGAAVDADAATVDGVREGVRRIESWTADAAVRTESLLRTRARLAARPEPVPSPPTTEPEPVTRPRPNVAVVTTIASVIVCIVAIVIFMSLR